MAKYLVIVESPAKVNTIKKFLGSNYEVVASQGHVRDLPKSQLGVSPENNFDPKYITIRGKGDLLAGLRKEVKKAEIIYLATDPDREGEAISWHLKEYLKLHPDIVPYDFYVDDGSGNPVKERYDPSAIYLTKYFESDYSADNTVVSRALTAVDINKIRVHRTDPIPDGTTLALYDGQLVSGSYINNFKIGHNFEYVIDRDVVSTITLDRSSDTCPIYENLDGKKRLLVHVPLADNKDKYLITYNTCDVYLIPQRMNRIYTLANKPKEISGVYVHQCERGENFHQLTFNDFSIDLDLLDQSLKPLLLCHVFVDLFLFIGIKKLLKKEGLRGILELLLREKPREILRAVQIKFRVALHCQNFAGFVIAQQYTAFIFTHGFKSFPAEPRV